MKTIPMIFNTEMVKALLDGRKTVTRRPVKDNHLRNIEAECPIRGIGSYENIPSNDIGKISGVNIDDLIWVRETSHCLMTKNESGWLQTKKRYLSADGYSRPNYSVDDFHLWKTIPSIHMPRWASRLTLRVTDVRIERVQDITEEQAKFEGCNRNVWFSPSGSSEEDWVNFDGMLHSTFITGFANIWESIHSNWNENPYVWVIEFEVIHRNVDEI